MTQLRIAVDFDEVVCQLLPEIYRIAGLPFNYEMISDYSIPPSQFGRDKFYELLSIAHSSPELKPMPYAIETIKWLQDEFDVFILSSNSERERQAISQWLFDRGIICQVLLSSNFEAKFDSEYNWDVLIDDHPLLHEMTIKYQKTHTIQFPMPYNRCKKYSDKAWQLIPSIIDDILKFRTHVI